MRFVTYFPWGLYTKKRVKKTKMGGYYIKGPASAGVLIFFLEAGVKGEKNRGQGTNMQCKPAQCGT